MVGGLKDMGVFLQLQAEKETQGVKNPYPDFVPTITYNGVDISFLFSGFISDCFIFVILQVFNQVLQNRSLYEFKTVVCEQIQNAASIC